jgi:glycosyltransferase involved in cell wall biosynthesis
MTEPRGPFVSIIIPAYFSVRTLPACLDALREQTYRAFEIILINSSPETATESLIRFRYPEVHFEQQPQRLLPHAARNRGAAFARGDLFVFTDPDCSAEPEWLERLVQAYSGSCQVLVGSMDLAGRDLWETAIHLIKYHWLLPGFDAATKSCAPTSNAAYSRQIWEKIGPFPGAYFSGDGILSYRAVRAAHAPRFVPSAIIRHRHLNSAPELACQRFSRGSDYARAQLCEMEPPGFFDWMRLLFSWVALPLVLARAGRDARRSGWLRPFLLTLPVQVMGHGMWALGESCGALATALSRFWASGEK